MRVRRLLPAVGFLLVLAGCSTHTVAPLPTTPLSSLTVAPSADTLHVGDHATFTVVAVDTNGATVANPVLAWSSSNTNVFRVSSTGDVTAIAEGLATLSVSSGGRTATAQILVLPTQRGWFAQPSSVLEDLHGVFFTADGNYGWAVGSTGKIIATTNAGATWNTQGSTVNNTLNAVWFTTASEGWVVGNGGRILRTTNRGALWTRRTGVPRVLGLSRPPDRRPREARPAPRPRSGRRLFCHSCIQCSRKNVKEAIASIPERLYTELR